MICNDYQYLDEKFPNTNVALPIVLQLDPTTNKMKTILIARYHIVDLREKSIHCLLLASEIRRHAVDVCHRKRVSADIWDNMRKEKTFFMAAIDYH